MIKDNINNIIDNNWTKGLISIAASVVMYFTPDNIDHIIESLLALQGIKSITLDKKKK